jgi:hypothetical protein
MRSTIAISTIALACFTAPALAAEMGRAPVSSGVYVTAEGGFLYLDGTDVIGHAISPAGVVTGPETDTTVNAQNGWTAGGSIGFASTGALIGGLPFRRAEAYYSYTTADDERTDTVAAPSRTSLKSVDATALGVVGFTATSEIERRSSEGGIRFASDQATGAGSSLSWIVMPFVRNSDETTASIAIGTVDTAVRSADVETWSYGVAVLVEPEVWLNSTVALTGRLGAGIYGYEADGNFSSGSTAPAPDPFAASLSDTESGVGFRGLIGAGVKLKIAQAMTLTGYAEADYLSRVGSAALPDNQFASKSPARVDTTDTWDLRAGARLSIGLNPNN